jgi:tetratricopeptide (TPR) repeat protein
MERMEPPDLHALTAAVGWLELGNASEAEAELAGISPENQHHPDTLEVRWAILAHTHRWETALETARALLDQAPNRSSAWLHHAYALRRVPEGGIQKAWEALLPAYERFPKEATIPYNLSCYACQLEQLEAARVWLRRALHLGDRETIKQMALEDRDLEPLWEEIRHL